MKEIIKKQCIRCEKTKDSEHFDKAKLVNGRTRTDLVCKKCRKIEIVKSNFVVKHENMSMEDILKEQASSNENYKNYKLTKEEYIEMYVQQEGKCEICGVAQEDLNKPLNIDHCHSTNEVRGLLCTGCNFGLGFFKDNISNLRKAIVYLGGRPGNYEDAIDKLKKIEEILKN